MFLPIKETDNPNKFSWLKYWIISFSDGKWALINREEKTVENLKTFNFTELTAKMEQLWQKHQSKSEVEA